LDDVGTDGLGCVEGVHFRFLFLCFTKFVSGFLVQMSL
jgi:hypothetical protein